MPARAARSSRGSRPGVTEATGRALRQQRLHPLPQPVRHQLRDPLQHHLAGHTGKAATTPAVPHVKVKSVVGGGPEDLDESTVRRRVQAPQSILTPTALVLPVWTWAIHYERGRAAVRSRPRRARPRPSSTETSTADAVVAMTAVGRRGAGPDGR